jgi:hypothetical protein
MKIQLPESILDALNAAQFSDLTEYIENYVQEAIAENEQKTQIEVGLKVQDEIHTNNIVIPINADLKQYWQNSVLERIKSDDYPEKSMFDIYIKMIASCLNK